MLTSGQALPGEVHEYKRNVIISTRRKWGFVHQQWSLQNNPTKHQMATICLS